MHHFPPARLVGRSATPVFPPLSPSPSVVCRFAPRRRRSCATQPAGRVGGPVRVEFSPQAGQPNGNKKLRQTALPTPRRPVNIATERESVAESGTHNSVDCPRQKNLWIGYPVRGGSLQRVPSDVKRRHEHLSSQLFNAI